jgi:hypothetical protein
MKKSVNGGGKTREGGKECETDHHMDESRLRMRALRLTAAKRSIALGPRPVRTWMMSSSGRRAMCVASRSSAGFRSSADGKAATRHAIPASVGEQRVSPGGCAGADAEGTGADDGGAERFDFGAADSACSSAAWFALSTGGCLPGAISCVKRGC